MRKRVNPERLTQNRQQADPHCHLPIDNVTEDNLALNRLQQPQSRKALALKQAKVEPSSQCRNPMWIVLVGEVE